MKYIFRHSLVTSVGSNLKTEKLKRIKSIVIGMFKNVERDVKAEKLKRIKSIVKGDLAFIETAQNLNFLSGELRERYGIVDTVNVSSNEYDPIALSYIEKHPDGLLLDCGAGRRSTYYANVVNFEIAAYDTTDVLGVGEELPFLDHSFDAVFSLAVLEHVKDPFKCAAEISRVLKPGGTLYCVVPFLQPVHAFPHHYYNLSAQGLKNLFDQHLNIDAQEIIASGLPIWALSWMVTGWAPTSSAIREVCGL